MPRDGAIIFGDLIGKLDSLRVTFGACGRRYTSVPCSVTMAVMARSSIGSMRLLPQFTSKIC
jgi:hypothetical protein